MGRLTVATPNPVFAEDAAKVGVLAGLRLAAAGGKTTLGEGAGAIEAAVIGADAIQQAGYVVSAIVNNARGIAEAPRRVVVLANDEVLALNQPDVVLRRIAAVRSLYDGIDCGGSADEERSLVGAPPAILKDVVGAIATDTKISRAPRDALSLPQSQPLARRMLSSAA